MEKRIKNRFSDQILHAAMQRFGIQAGHIELLDGFESFLYAYDKDGEKYILRIGHLLRRNSALIQGEVDWINYLAAGGAGVARAIFSEQGNLVEAIDDDQGSQFLATAFTYARGTPPGKNHRNPAFYASYGRTIGKLHALTKQYTPGCRNCYRMHWNDPMMQDVIKLPVEGNQKLLDIYQQLMDHLLALPVRADSYGLIHQDAHAGNLFVDSDNRITLFDFDDCAYSWFINDIAIVFFYALMYPPDRETIREFVVPFFQGYREENHLDPVWLAEIPYFLKLREIDLYAVIHRTLTPEEIAGDAWISRYMHSRRERLENNQPYHDFDYTTLAEYL